MGIWENLGIGSYRGFFAPGGTAVAAGGAAGGDLGCEQADTSHLLLAMLRQQGAAAQFSPGKTSPSQRCAASWRSGAAPRYSG